MYFEVQEDEIELVERGWCWRHFHAEPIEFPSLALEAQFYHDLGHYDPIQRPAEVRRWDRDSLVAALSAGLGDTASVGSAVFVPLGDERDNCLIKFHDPELGERVRAASLAGFGIVPQPA